MVTIWKKGKPVGGGKLWRVGLYSRSSPTFIAMERRSRWPWGADLKNTNLSEKTPWKEKPLRRGIQQDNIVIDLWFSTFFRPRHGNGPRPGGVENCYKWLERTHGSVKWGAWLAGLNLRILLPKCSPLKHSDYSVHLLLTLETPEFWPQCAGGLCTGRTISNYLFSMDYCINWLIIG